MIELPAPFGPLNPDQLDPPEGSRSEREAIEMAENEVNEAVVERACLAIREALEGMDDILETLTDDEIEAAARAALSAAGVAGLVSALERIADPRNRHFAGDAQVVARSALSSFREQKA